MKHLLLSLLVISIIGTLSINAQETTGKLEGNIISATNEPIDLATILVIDTETNFKYGTISQPSGYYIVTGLPPGTAYQMEVSFVGYETTIVNNVRIDLGAVTQQDVTLIEANNNLEEVIITVDQNDIKKTNEQLIGKKLLKSTPTINRGIQDLTRNLPEANLNSFAGASNRFNNLNIDGIANNDVIGFQRDKMNKILKNIERYDDYELNDIFEKNNQKWVDWCNDIILYHAINKMLNNVCIPIIEDKQNIYNKALQKLKDCIL